MKPSRQPAPRACDVGRAPETRIETLPDLPSLIAREAQWRVLWHSLPDATPFQSPTWLLCWARHYAPDRTGAISVTMRDRMLALLPYFIWNGAIRLAGTGPSDYGDALVAPEATSLADALLETLAGLARERGCNRIDLRQLRPQSRLCSVAAPTGWRSEAVPDETCTSVQLRGESGLDALSERWRRNAAYAWRRLERTGSCRLERVPADDSSHAADTLLRLHQRRWTARGEPGLFADRLLHAFIREVIPSLGSAGLLRMYVLVCGGEPIAAAFAMRAPGTTHLYSTGFDPAWSRYSPGLLSIVAAIRGAAAEGDREFHLLRGRERYKRHLGAIECPTWRRTLRRQQSQGTSD